MLPNKACPIVVWDLSFSKLLVFKHPMAGIQFVKGTIEPGERPDHAALRELCEESGICDASIHQDLGLWSSDFKNQVWSLQLCFSPRPLPESWTYRTEDGGGLEFKFRWHALDQAPDEGWHPVHRRALDYIVQRLRRC